MLVEKPLGGHFKQWILTVVGSCCLTNSVLGALKLQQSVMNLLPAETRRHQHLERVGKSMPTMFHTFSCHDIQCRFQRLVGQRTRHVFDSQYFRRKP